MTYGIISVDALPWDPFAGLSYWDLTRVVLGSFRAAESRLRQAQDQQ